MTPPQLSATPPPFKPVRFLELEITSRCQLACSHCYSESGPTSGHGTMTLADWKSLITSAPAAGITTVQLIGGEPTQHPDFGKLLTHALAQGLKVQVFSNLYRVGDGMWRLLDHPNVTLATSYYSDNPHEHDHITGRDGSHGRTLTNIIEALRRGIPLKVAIVQVLDGQRVEQARKQMQLLGVNHVGPIDRMRGVGRGADTLETNVGELCGQCGDGRAAVSPNGDVTMCVLSRFLPPAGNVKTTPLAEIFAGISWANLLAQVPRPTTSAACKPGSDGNDCAPAETICEGDSLNLPRQRRPLYPAVAKAFVTAMSAEFPPSGGDTPNRGPA